MDYDIHTVYIECPSMSGYDLPDEQYLMRLGKAMYLFSLLEGFSVTTVVKLYAYRYPSHRLLEVSSYVREQVYTKFSSGSALKRGLEKIRSDFEGDDEHKKDLEYVVEVINTLFNGRGKNQSIVDRRNILSHAWYGFHPTQESRLVRRYVNNKDAAREVEPGKTSVMIDDAWILDYIESLEEALSTLMEIAKTINAGTLTFGSKVVPASLYMLAIYSPQMTIEEVEKIKVEGIDGLIFASND